MIEQYESDRLCRKCNEWKPASAFPARPDRPCGRYSRCLKCRAAYNTAYAQRRRRGIERKVVTPSEFPVVRRNTRLRKWRYPVVKSEPRFGVAMIGGGYV